MTSDHDNSEYKRTKAGVLGKTTGRWTLEEHKKFIEGKTNFLTFRSQTVRQELEKSGGLYRNPHGHIDTEPRPEIL
jgi:hypothetical protein